MDQLIETIMDWVYMNYGGDVELKIGIWDVAADPHTFYAVIVNAIDQSILLGESSYGAYTVHDALGELVSEIGSDRRHATCGNCGNPRAIENGHVLECANCGDDEYEIATAAEAGP